MRVKKPRWLKAWPAAEADAILPDGGVPPEKLDGSAGNVSDLLTLDALKVPVWAAQGPPVAHTHAATDITSGTLDGDRLPALSATKRGGAPMTGAPSGTKFLRDDDTWATPAGGSGLSQAQVLARVRIGV